MTGWSCSCRGRCRGPDILRIPCSSHRTHTGHRFGFSSIVERCARCAYGLRKNFPSIIPGIERSATYLAFAGDLSGAVDPRHRLGPPPKILFVPYHMKIGFLFCYGAGIGGSFAIPPASSAVKSLDMESCAWTVNRTICWANVFVVQPGARKLCSRNLN